jgi:hypothetical protein
VADETAEPKQAEEKKPKRETRKRIEERDGQKVEITEFKRADGKWGAIPPRKLGAKKAEEKKADAGELSGATVVAIVAASVALAVGVAFAAKKLLVPQGAAAAEPPLRLVSNG